MMVPYVLHCRYHCPSSFKLSLGRPILTWLHLVADDVKLMNFRIYTAWQKAADCAAADTTNFSCELSVFHIAMLNTRHLSSVVTARSKSTIFKSKGGSEFTVLKTESKLVLLQ